MSKFIEIRIDEIVLDGFALGDEDAIHTAVAQELARTLTRQRFSQSAHVEAVAVASAVADHVTTACRGLHR